MTRPAHDLSSLRHSSRERILASGNGLHHVTLSRPGSDCSAGPPSGSVSRQSSESDRPLTTPVAVVVESTLRTASWSQPDGGPVVRAIGAVSSALVGVVGALVVGAAGLDTTGAGPWLGEAVGRGMVVGDGRAIGDASLRECDTAVAG